MKFPGVQVNDETSTFVVWAPLRKSVALHIFQPFNRIVPMIREHCGYWTASIEGVGHGALYMYQLDEEVERPDPASSYQPKGVHEPSMVVDHRRFEWSDESQLRRELDDYIIYEMHVGTFTARGTFAEAVTRIPELVRLGITAVEIMPVAQFPGEMNWGYDGVYPFAVQNSYGGVEGLKLFVNECHRCNLTVILDVVYNHLGPEGNYFRDFGPYFTNKYQTPWGESINFDGAYSDGVGDFFIENACYWFREFHIDALRLDAVHAICDMGAKPFLQRLSKRVEEEFCQQNSQKYLIAESDLNDTRVISDRTTGGLGMHAQWSDDFHHALHTLLTGEKLGYYADFGTMEHMVRVLTNAFCYSGDYSGSRKRSHGNDASDFNTGTFVVCSQNHDQIGNRMLGERLVQLSGVAQARLGAAMVLLSPYIPLLFMGEEHGEDNPFLYFADHSDEQLKKAVREGRRAEFAEFHGKGDPPNPFDRTTLVQSKPDWTKQTNAPGSLMLSLYRELIWIRTSSPAIGPNSRENIDVTHYCGTFCVSINYKHATHSALCLFNVCNEQTSIDITANGKYQKLLDSSIPQQSDNLVALPEWIRNGENKIHMAPYGFAMYESRNT